MRTHRRCHPIVTPSDIPRHARAIYGVLEPRDKFKAAGACTFSGRVVVRCRYVMAYDVQSQIVGRCLADANSPLGATMLGLQGYLDLGVPRSKLILGVPWYGFDWGCQDGAGSAAHQLLASPYCPVSSVPFRGAPCSDAAGSEKPYVSIQQLIASGGNVTQFWDNTTMTPFLNYLHPVTGQRRQLWWDDPRSTAAKLEVAADLGIAGFGPYEFSDLDYTASGKGASAAMWEVLRRYSKPADGRYR